MFDTGKRKADFELEQERIDALQYLKDTDWMVIREIESGKKTPGNIKALRTDARIKANKE